MQLPNRVDILDGANITKWVNEKIPGRKDWSARAILASDKDMVPHLYTKLAIDFCCSGRIRFGYIKGQDPNAKSALQQLDVTKFPTLMIGRGRALGTGKDTIVYDGALQLKALRNWAAGYDDSRKIPQLVQELSDEGIMQRECAGLKKGWCFILLMPNDVAVFDDTLELMAEVARRKLGYRAN